MLIFANFFLDHVLTVIFINFLFLLLTIALFSKSCHNLKSDLQAASNKLQHMLATSAVHSDSFTPILAF